MPRKSMQKPLLEPPPGYDEIGETLAQPVAEGYQTLEWAKEIGKLLGHSEQQIKKWVRWYRQEHEQELRELESRRKRTHKAIKEKRAKVQEILLAQEPDT